MFPTYIFTRQSWWSESPAMTHDRSLSVKWGCVVALTLASGLYGVQVLVDLELHQDTPTGRERSRSRAISAAYCSAAWMSSSSIRYPRLHALPEWFQICRIQMDGQHAERLRVHARVAEVLGELLPRSEARARIQLKLQRARILPREAFEREI